jgi:hypothetical protein
VILLKIVKQLRREVTSNPKKAAILGMGLLIAVYFWVPLVWGWIGKGRPAVAAAKLAAAPSVTPLAPPTATATASAAKKESEPAQYTWQQLVEWMDHDPRKLPADLGSADRDPFQGLETIVVPKHVLQLAERPAVEEKQLTPAGLGLVLSSTLIASRRTAVINAKTYEEGKKLDFSFAGQRVTFLLAEVHPRGVVLARNGERFDLPLRRRNQAGTIELVGNKE